MDPGGTRNSSGLATAATFLTIEVDGHGNGRAPMTARSRVDVASAPGWARSVARPHVQDRGCTPLWLRLWLPAWRTHLHCSIGVGPDENAAGKETQRRRRLGPLSRGTAVAAAGAPAFGVSCAVPDRPPEVCAPAAASMPETCGTRSATGASFGCGALELVEDCAAIARPGRQGMARSRRRPRQRLGAAQRGTLPALRRGIRIRRPRARAASGDVTMRQLQIRCEPSDDSPWRCPARRNDRNLPRSVIVPTDPLGSWPHT